MTDPDGDALYRAIVRHPDDDTPRLVYADWLAENGRGEEGEFVRVQCRLAATDPDDPEYPALLDREEELRLWLTAHAPGPRPTFPGGVSVEGGTRWWTYSRRGFPRFLEFEGCERPGTRAVRALASGLKRAFDSLPTRWLVVREVTLAQLASLLKQPVIAKLHQLTVQLSVTGDEADAAARLLAQSRHLRNLRGLSLAVPFGDAGAESLAAAPWGGLEWFAPDCAGLTAAGLRALAGADWFRSLRELTLDDGLAEDTFAALARVPVLPHLHTLDLSRNAFSAAAWQSVARSRALPALARLQIDQCEMMGGQWEAVTGATGFALRALSANSCGLAPGAGAALAAAPWAAGLHALNLGVNALPAADTKAVAASPAFCELRHLDLAHNELNPATLTALAANPALRGLRLLDLGGGLSSGRGPTPTHFGRFLAKLDMPDLRYLGLSRLPLGPKAARLLTDPKFASLTRLSLNECRLTDPAVAALLAAPALGNLVQLDLEANDLKTSPELLTDRSVLPRLARCNLIGNRIPPNVARRLRRRAGVRV